VIHSGSFPKAFTGDCGSVVGEFAVADVLITVGLLLERALGYYKDLACQT